MQMCAVGNLVADLDYLVLDMPPGTRHSIDTGTNIPGELARAVVVITPQDIALIDAKGIVMFEKVEVPVLGIVENMSVHICSNCGHHEPIFGTGGAEKLAEKYHTQLLGQMPLHISLREDLDKGTPTVISRPESEFTAIYRRWLTALQPSFIGRRSHSWRDFLPRGLTRINLFGCFSYTAEMYIDAVYLFLPH